jgi:hypothetical protein
MLVAGHAEAVATESTERDGTDVVGMNRSAPAEVLCLPFHSVSFRVTPWILWLTTRRSFAAQDERRDPIEMTAIRDHDPRTKG